MKNEHNSDSWDLEWQRLDPEKEIKMWDFYGGRQWILKYTPRFGTVLEAGCGLGRYVFYLAELGIDCIGLDFSEEAIATIKLFQNENNIQRKFCKGNVKLLPFRDNSIAGYISLGVIEHFIEGPQLAIKEAYRVLRPGGIAIITTPSLSFSQIYLHSKAKIKASIKKLIKIILRYPLRKPPFFQYWYRPNVLKNFVQSSGFKVVLSTGSDLFYCLYELGYIPAGDSKFNRIISYLNNTIVANAGAQSITISYKSAALMHCFLCGNLNVFEKDLKAPIPICDNCINKPWARYYLQGSRLKLSKHYLINPYLTSNVATCEYCGNEYKISGLFEYYGFAVKVCKNCLKDPAINIELSNLSIQPIWRKRG